MSRASPRTPSEGSGCCKQLHIVHVEPSVNDSNNELAALKVWEVAYLCMCHGNTTLGLGKGFTGLIGSVNSCMAAMSMLNYSTPKHVVASIAKSAGDYRCLYSSKETFAELQPWTVFLHAMLSALQRWTLRCIAPASSVYRT